ncbi:MAG: ABC transporter ATP-binding protein [Planctomycetota bacterium]|nr:ABC transporter ATP-binding protein [Planctomycetota bacterium]
MNDTGTRSADPLLVAESLHKTYRLGDVEVPVLKGASLEVAAGEWVAILGSSGSGKSTLLHLLGGLDRPDPGAGRIVFDGEDISLQNRRERNIYRNRSIGFVFQYYHLLPELTVSENALLPTMVASSIPGARERARELLERFGLGHRLEHRPRELSGGERQRVAIARALANGPQVLLADEPTGNLDEGTGRGILDLLAQEHAEGLGIVMVTHDPSIAELADRVVELHHGQVVQADPVSR